MDRTFETERVEPTPEESVDAVAEALASLTEVLAAIPSPTRRARLASEAAATLRSYAEAEVEVE